jgi:hypothetical protein
MTAPLDVHGYSSFSLRRAMERLREGLFDPLAVRLLTVRHDELEARLRQDRQRLEAGDSAHLCVCGAYGQGKSHTLAYVQAQALQHNYGVSAINLDPREVPWHRFREVYRALLMALTFPVSEASPAPHNTLVSAWQAWARQQVPAGEDRSPALAALLPADMPHVFKAILVALAQPTLRLSPAQQATIRYRDYRPTLFPDLLRRALYGETVPVALLRSALKYRQVSFYRQGSLALTGDEPFLRMLETLPQLLRCLGYGGWVVLFDEAEAISQVQRPLRARSYCLLHRLLLPTSPLSGLYPVFAVTPDFFQRLQQEDFTQPPFTDDYARAWRHLSIYQLQSLSAAAWQHICQQLITLHAAAYAWPADAAHLMPRLTACLQEQRLPEPRFVLKALVDVLDQEQQQAFFAQRFGDGP